MIKFLGLGIKTKIRLPRKGDPENLMEQWIEALGFFVAGFPGQLANQKKKIPELPETKTARNFRSEWEGFWEMIWTGFRIVS